MGAEKLDLRSNGTKSLATNESYNAPSRLWKRLQMNEWTFSLLLFLFSLSIVLGKLYINYGSILQPQKNIKHVESAISMFSNTSNVFGLSYIPNASLFNAKQLIAMSEKFVNISQYDDVVCVMTLFLKTYGWLIRAAVCGLVMMGFTWFIIYNDSSIPGINPPSPFSPSKQRFADSSGVQINYMIGILNGILIFVYMCL